MLGACLRCGTPASAVMAFTYIDRTIWLKDLEGSDLLGRYPLCAGHSDRMTPPLGWTLTDRRWAGRLFGALEVA